MDHHVGQPMLAVQDATAAVVDDATRPLRDVAAARREVLRRGDDTRRAGVHAEPARPRAAQPDPHLRHVLHRDRAVGERDFDGFVSLVGAPGLLGARRGDGEDERGGENVAKPHRGKTLAKPTPPCNTIDAYLGSCDEPDIWPVAGKDGLS
jgi:hypothetical protein